jgi:type III secretion protein J
MGARSARAALLAILCAACRSPLVGGLSEQQANEIVVALDVAAIPAAKMATNGGSPTGFRIEVAGSDVARALRVLHDSKLPSAPMPGFEALYAGQSLVATPQEERARWAMASAGELATSLERLDGVLDARVLLVPRGDARPLDASPEPAKASVLLQRRKGSRPIDVRAIRDLVAGAVEGLEAGRVTVVQAEAADNTAKPKSFVRVGPATVTAESAPALRWLLAGGLVLNLLMAAAFAWAWRGRRKRM